MPPQRKAMRKYYLYLGEEERQLVLHALIDFRNKLLTADMRKRRMRVRGKVILQPQGKEFFTCDGILVLRPAFSHSLSFRMARIVLY